MTPTTSSTTFRLCAVFSFISILIAVVFFVIPSTLTTPTGSPITAGSSSSSSSSKSTPIAKVTAPVVAVPDESSSPLSPAAAAAAAALPGLSWRPQRCGSLYADNTTLFKYHLADSGVNLSELIVLSAKDRGAPVPRFCAAWDTGQFVSVMRSAVVEKVREQLLLKEFLKVADPILVKNQKQPPPLFISEVEAPFPWDDDGVPDLFSDGNGVRFPRLQCSVGPCLCSIIAKRVREMDAAQKAVLSPVQRDEFKRWQDNSMKKVMESRRNKVVAEPRRNKVVAEPPPRWILFVGDSRFRHLLARFIAMVRSEYADLSSERDAANKERRRLGVIEHYFHRNATFMVWGVKQKSASSSTAGSSSASSSSSSSASSSFSTLYEQGGSFYRATRDRLKMLDEGEGCPTDVVAETGQDDDEAGVGSAMPPTREEGEVVLFRVCLWWQTQSAVLAQEGPDILQALRPIAVSWMPTLHECMGRNRRSKVNNKFTKCSVDHRSLVGVAKSNVETMEGAGAGIVRNFLVLSTPNSVMAPERSIAYRNRAVCSGLEWASKARLGGNSSTRAPPLALPGDVKKSNSKNGKSAPTMRNEVEVEMQSQQQQQQQQQYVASARSLKNPSLRQTFSLMQEVPQGKRGQLLIEEMMQVNKLKVSPFRNYSALFLPKPQLDQWFLDMGGWWHFVRPSLCDKTHSMCNLKPHRPLDADHVTFFCNGCRDEVGFVAIEQMLRVLLA